MQKKQKILYYNWVPFDNKRGFGGGISVYLKNFIGEIIKNKNYSIYFLNSGYKYNPAKNEPYIKKSKTIYGNKCNSFEIINSPIIAPLGNLAWNIDKYLNDTESYNIFKKFIIKYGPFDIIHINNIGGFSQKVLTLKKEFPDTKFIFDLHNYNSLCMNSYLFNHNESTMCEDFCDGKKCLECYSKTKIIEHLYNSKVNSYWNDNKLDRLIYRIKTGFKDNYYDNWKKYYICEYEKSLSSAEAFKTFRENNVKYINENFDKILAVSKRVKDVAISYGLDKNKIEVSYIGTKFAENIKPPKTINKDKKLKIAYLGYANVLKGFHFFIETLNRLPQDIASNIDIVLAAKNIKEDVVKENLKYFNSLTIYNGYTHDNIETILEDVDLGIVPVLWEDNLPQVAIEMVSNGVPILCRNLGGASELSDTEEFKFSNQDELIEKLKLFVENRDKLSEYWKSHNKLTTLKENLQNIEKIYNM